MHDDVVPLVDIDIIIGCLSILGLGKAHKSVDKELPLHLSSRHRVLESKCLHESGAKKPAELLKCIWRKKFDLILCDGIKHIMHLGGVTASKITF